MAKSDRYKQLKRNAIIFGILSYGLWLVLAIVYMISAFCNLNAVHEGVQIFTDEAKMIIVSMSITAIIGIIMTFFLKEGMRTFIWIICVILGSLVYKETGMYIALGLWFVDDYIIHKLFIYYKNKLSIRKEIEYDNKGEKVNDGEQEE